MMRDPDGEWRCGTRRKYNNNNKLRYRPSDAVDYGESLYQNLENCHAGLCLLDVLDVQHSTVCNRVRLEVLGCGDRPAVFR